MCTVTFLAVKNHFYITSSRDEKMMRKNAVHPASYKHGSNNIIYPKDAEAGGTWIAMKDNADAAVLLNGAFKKHEPQPPYQKSRGLVFLDIFSEASPADAFNNITLKNIEPFTVVIFENNLLFECRWDGHQKYQRQLNIQQPHIWSSATLYEEAVVKRREEWFNIWLQQNPEPAQEDILLFHQFGGEADAHNGFLMNRNNFLLTVSITGIHLQNDIAIMNYLDIKQNSSSIIRAHFKETAEV